MVKRTLVLLIAILILSALPGCGEKTVGSSAGMDPSTPGKTGSAGAGQLISGIPLDQNAAVVVDMTADVFTEPDVKSDRITQALFNQPVSIIEEKDSWSKVKTVDGSVGWTRTKSIDRDVSSISGGNADRRIIITSRTKSIYSEPEGGITLKDAVMGSEFRAFAKSGDAFNVYLPGNVTGWLKGSGIISLGLGEGIPLTNRADFVATALKFKGTSYLEKGLSSLGIDSPGLVYISAVMNGLDMPRSLDGQLLKGSGVQAGNVEEGDLVFLSQTGDKNDITEVGICTGNGRYIFSGRLTGYVAYGKLDEKNTDGEPVAFRRVFPD